MELGKVSASYEGLKDLILREQFLTVSNRNLVLFLKERKIKSIKEMAELAEQYNEAHSVSDAPFRQFSPNRTDNKSDMFRKDNYKNANADEAQQSRVFKERFCYGCGKKDHFIRSCPVRNFTNQSTGTKVASLEVVEDQKQVSEEPEKDEEIHESIDEAKMTVATDIVFTPTSHIYSVATSQYGTGSKSDERKEIEIVNISCHGSAEIVSL